MKIHYLQHAPAEGLGSMEPALIARGHQLSSTKLYAHERLPAVEEIDWLIVMGGSMGVHDEDACPWLKIEKKFIKEAIFSKKKVLGICLGAQLIAHVLGANVHKNKYREIGWFNIIRSNEIENTILSKVIPQEIEVFHWHEDTFDIPRGAKPIAQSHACANQGFIIDDRIVAFQFHLEITVESASAFIESDSDDLADQSSYVQSAEEILSTPQKFSNSQNLMFSILNAMENRQ